MKFNLDNLLNGKYSQSPEVGTFPGVLGLWRKAGCISFKIRKGLSIKSHQNANWSYPPESHLLTQPGMGLRTGAAITPQMYPARRKGEIY